MLCFCTHAWLLFVLRILVISVPLASENYSECSTLAICPLGQAVLV